MGEELKELKEKEEVLTKREKKTKMKQTDEHEKPRNSSVSI